MRQDDRAEFECVQDQWALAVGRFMLRFGEIEHFVDQVLVHIPRENQLPRTWTKFSARAGNAIKAVEARNLRKSTRDLFVCAINAALRMEEDRNLIAHNSTMLGVYSSLEGELAFRMKISSRLSDRKVISIAQLEEWTEEARGIAVDLDAGLRAAHWEIDKPIE